MQLSKILLICMGLLYSHTLIADCVVLLHGLARTADAMQDLEDALTAEQFRVANIDYPSREKTIAELAPGAIEAGIEQCNLAANEKIHFVTHSMGGILVRYYLASREIEDLGHVVMIAPPNKGSEVVDALGKMPGFSLINGPAGAELGTSEDSVPLNLGAVEFSVGIIAGVKTFNPILSQFLPNPDDGKVSVESTKVEGMADFVTVDASHPFIMNDESVIQYTITFLRSGSFDSDETVLAITSAESETLAPFESDGCSSFPDGTLSQQALWLDCCTAHDLAYWRGGTAAERLAADNALEQCVATVGEPEIASIMLTGVRVGGTPYLPTKFRWGYGWPFPRGYKALTQAEQEAVDKALSTSANIKDN